MTTTKIAILGFGTVGKSFLDLLQNAGSSWTSQYDVEFEIAEIAKRSWSEEEKKLAANIAQTSDAIALADSGNYDILVELIGGTGVARSCVESALKQGKTVVTANKALLSECGDSLFQLAYAHNAVLRFEAAVAGAIPVISLLRNYFHSDQIHSVRGILNGTCNYILSQMEEAGRGFDDVLSEAQELGYAEADPTADIDGWDAAHKTAILTRLAFGRSISVEDFTVKGIRKVTAQDIRAADELGYRIRLIGQTQKIHEETFAVSTVATLVDKASVFGTAVGPGNVVQISSKYASTVAVTGPGAGGDATAQAVAADVLGCMRASGPANNLNSLQDSAKDIQQNEIPESRWYCRIHLPDAPGTMAAFTSVAARLGINLQDVLQHRGQSNEHAQVVCTTDIQTQGKITSLQQELQKEFAEAELLTMPILEES